MQQNGETADVACDSYNKLEDDIKAINNIQLNSYKSVKRTKRS